MTVALDVDMYPTRLRHINDQKELMDLQLIQDIILCTLNYEAIGHPYLTSFQDVAVCWRQGCLGHGAIGTMH